MQTQLHLKLRDECRTRLYLLPFGAVDLPPGAYIPASGEVVTMPVFKPQAQREVLEPRNFEVVTRSSYFQLNEATDGLFRVEVTLELKDLGSAMPNEQGFGALGMQDPVQLRGNR